MGFGQDVRSGVGGASDVALCFGVCWEVLWFWVVLGISALDLAGALCIVVLEGLILWGGLRNGVKV